MAAVRFDQAERCTEDLVFRGLEGYGSRGAKAQLGETRPIVSTRRPEVPPAKMRRVRGSMNPA